VLVERKESEGFAAVENNGIIVALDTKLTPVLIQEGLVRDFIRHVQTMRKEADFQVEDRIRVTYEAPDEFRAAVTRHLEYFKNETLAQTVSETYSEGEYGKDLKIEGNKVRVSLTRIK
jgi:isoleucyl-tRNA synthetase